MTALGRLQPLTQIAGASQFNDHSIHLKKTFQQPLTAAKSVREGCHLERHSNSLARPYDSLHTKRK